MFSFWFLDKGRFVFLSHVKEREAAAMVETLAAAVICLVLAVYDRKSTDPASSIYHSGGRKRWESQSCARNRDTFIYEEK
jgi:hypothetical protein